MIKTDLLESLMDETLVDTKKRGFVGDEAATKLHGMKLAAIALGYSVEEVDGKHYLKRDKRSQERKVMNNNPEQGHESNEEIAAEIEGFIDQLIVCGGEELCAAALRENG